MPGLKERAKTLVELADAAAFLAHTMPLPMEPKAAALLTPEARLMLRELAGRWTQRIFRPRRWMRRCGSSPRQRGGSSGQVAQPLRAALTGSTVSPGIDSALAALGREEALARIRAVG